jgi:hypothetical protein
VGKSDAVATDDGVAPNEALDADDGVGVTAVDGGEAHAPIKTATRTTTRIA